MINAVKVRASQTTFGWHLKWLRVTMVTVL